MPDIKDELSQAAHNIAHLPVDVVKDTAKSGINKLNPFDKPINKADVTDSGVESIKLGYRTIKQTKNTIKTTKNTIKTTQRTIKTTTRATKYTAKFAYRTVVTTTKAAVATVKITTNTITHILALAVNPVVVTLVGLLVVFIYSAGILVALIGGDTTDKSAMSGAAGLVTVNQQYQDATSFLNTAIANRKSGFESMINSLIYDTNNLGTSDLVYMERTLPSPTTIYQTSFPTSNQKNTLISAWNLNLDTNEVIAIAYVYLERIQNTANNTQNEIYPVTYTQDTFDFILEKYAQYTDTVYSSQRCPQGNCTQHVETKPNPDYQTAVDNVSFAANAYNDWADVIPYIVEYDNRKDQIRDGRAQAAYWDNTVQWRIDNWNSVYSWKWGNAYTNRQGQELLEFLGIKYEAYVDIMNHTPQTYDEITYICNCQHTLHSIGLAFNTSDAVMNSLNFTEDEKKWTQLTKEGFDRTYSTTTT